MARLPHNNRNLFDTVAKIGNLLECDGVVKLSSDAGSDEVNCVVVGPDTEYFT